jgi:hypothetical protein
MATTLTALAKLLDNLGWKHKPKPAEKNDKEGRIYTGFPTESYLDSDGDKFINVVFSVQENGELVKIIVPRLYNCIHPGNRKAFFETAIRKTFEKKLCFYDYDHRDGEIRMVLDIPLEDAVLTEKQVKRIVSGMVRLVDVNDPDIRAAVEQGRLPVIDYQSDLSYEISQMSVDQQLQLLVDIKKSSRESSAP